MAITFNYTGALQYYTVPSGVFRISMKVWGAGGGGGVFPTPSGAGGYSYGELNVTPGQVFQIMVGQGGRYNHNTGSIFGGGGLGGLGGFSGSSGGGRSGIGFVSQPQFIIAGGGGGSGPGSDTGFKSAGNGGGLLGIDEYLSSNTQGFSFLVPSKGGTQIAGGAGGQSTAYPVLNGLSGTSLQGGAGAAEKPGFNPSGGGGGGGGGYFGGGGAVSASDTSPNGNDEGMGGGGSGYINTAVIYNAYTLASPQTNTTPVGNVLPPNTTDPDYISGIATGKSSSVSGGNGLVVITDLPPLEMDGTKSVNKSHATLGDTITYTIVLNNPGGFTYTNFTFLDNIPTSTTFIPNTFAVNGVTTPDNPSTPGINLGTISATTLPAKTTNTVSTTISYATLITSKIVDKSFAMIGDTLTYTIVVTNTGNTTASNIVFLDTIPTNMTFINNSLNQDGVTIPQSPNSPGVTLPSSIGALNTSTISFKIQITTVPNNGVITNNAYLSSSYIINPSTTPNILGSSSSSSNTVNTTVSYANLGNMTKYTDKSFAECGDTITYTIVIPNSGNTTAQDIFLIDTIPNSTAFVANSVYVNNSQQLGYNPASGITVPNIGPLGVATVSFKVTVSC